MVVGLRRSVVIFGVALIFFGVFAVVALSGTMGLPIEPDAFRAVIEDVGALGPLVVIISIALAVVVSPIPSAPITFISGAAYGHFFGTIYALTGAQIGAMIAFYIARRLGRAPLRRLAGEVKFPSGLSSQNTLTAGVVLARLIPPISFDAISYLAGLSVITPVRFSLATLVGMIPMTFLFSYAGNEFVWGDGGMAGWVSLIAVSSVFVFGAVYARMRRVASPQEPSTEIYDEERRTP